MCVRENREDEIEKHRTVHKRLECWGKGEVCSDHHHQLNSSDTESLRWPATIQVAASCQTPYTSWGSAFCVDAWMDLFMFISPTFFPSQECPQGNQLENLCTRWPLTQQESSIIYDRYHCFIQLWVYPPDKPGGGISLVANYLTVHQVVLGFMVSSVLCITIVEWYTLTRNYLMRRVLFKQEYI